MARLATIMDELANVIRNALDDVTDVDVQVEGRMVVNPSPLTIDVYPADPSEDPEFAAFGQEVGGELLNVRARVSTAASEEGQELLLALMDDEDPLSIYRALQDDPTLNGNASDTFVRTRSGYVMFADSSGAGAYLGCLFGVVVVKAHS